MCDSCIYLIGVKAEAAVSFSISVKIEDSYDLTKDHKLKFSLFEKKVFKLRFTSNEKFKLIVKPFSGERIDVKVFLKSTENSLLSTQQCSE